MEIYVTNGYFFGASHIFWGMKDWAKWEISEMVVFSVGLLDPMIRNAKPSAVFV